MREAKVAPTLVNEWLGRTGLPWFRAVLAVGLVLFLLLIGAASLDGALTRPLDGSLWRLTLMPPATALYILLTYHLLIPILNGAVNAFQPLMTVDEEAFELMSTLVPIIAWAAQVIVQLIAP
jgi:hypothetical protein